MAKGVVPFFLKLIQCGFESKLKLEARSISQIRPHLA
jgi:hypothetical protein